MARLLEQSEAKKLGLPGRTSLEPVSGAIGSKVTFEPIAPEIGSSDVRPGRPSFFASDCFNKRAISPPVEAA